jgi:AcrR family transcriptional regulator
MPRKSNAKARRAEIAQALYRCIVKQGYMNTSVRDISKEAGIRNGLIHYYFESKDEILSEMIRDIFQKYSKRLQALTEANRDKSPKERLKLGIDFIFKRISGDRDLTRTFCEFWNLSEHDEELRKLLKVFYRNYRKTVEDFISDCLRESDGYSIEIRDLATFLVSAFEGACILWSTDPRGVSLTRLTKVTNQLLDPIIGSGE